MRTTSGWTANMQFHLSQKSFASTRRVNDSSTPLTQRRSSTPPSGTVPKPASSQATSVACCLRTCPPASPTSPATSNWLTLRPRQPKPQWSRRVRCFSSRSFTTHTHVHFLLFYKCEWNNWARQSKCASLWTCIIFWLQSSSSPALHGVSCYKAAVAYCWPSWHFLCCWKFTGCEKRHQNAAYVKP